MDATGVVNGLALTVIGSAYGLIFALLCILWNRIEKHGRDLNRKIEKVMVDINRLAEKFKKADELAESRLAILDRTLSVLTDKPFDSSRVVSGPEPQPSTEQFIRFFYKKYTSSEDDGDGREN